MGSKPVKPWRFVPFWPFVLVAALGLLWWQRIALVAWLVGFAPLPGDWRITHLELDDITFSRIQIDRLTVHHDPDPGNAEPLKLTMERLAVDYQLFAESVVSINNVNIGRASLRLADTESAMTAGSLLGEARSILQRPLPSLRLHAGQLHVEGARGEVLADTLAVDLESNGDSATATLHYDNRHAVLRIGASPDSLPQSMPADRQLSANQVAVLSLVATESGIRLDAAINPGQFLPVATALGLLPADYSDDYNLSGSLHLGLELFRTADDVVADFAIQPLDATSGPVTVAGLQANGRVSVAARQEPGLPFALHTANGMEIKAGRVAINGTTLDDIYLNVHGRLAVLPESMELKLDDQSRFTLASLNSRNTNSSVTIIRLEMTPEVLVTNSKITLGAKFSIQADRFATDGITINSISANPAAPVVLDREHQPFPYQPLGDWHVESSAALPGEIAVDSRLQINIVNPDPEHLDINLVAEQLQVSAPWPVPAIDTAEVTLASKGPAISAQGQVALEPLQNILDISFNHDPARDTTGIRIASTAAEPVPALFTMLEEYFPQALQGIAITAGQADLVGQVQWTGGDNNTETRLGLDLAGHDISGQLDAINFQGVNLDANAEIDPAGKLRGNVNATLDSVEYGLVIREIRSEFGFTHAPAGALPRLDFQDLSGILFDARFRSDPFQLDLNDPDTTVMVTVDNLDIARLVETQGIDHLSATGRVRGVFPVNIVQDSVSIVDGNVTNLPGGGRIRYDLPDQQASAMDNPLSDVVIAALRDFRYDLLIADTNYHPDGELYINFHLEGISPQLDPERRVNLNINTQQNVLSLLRSLNYSDGLNQTIDQQIQENMK